jgi:hypothetical protein
MTAPINPARKLSPAYGEIWDDEQDERLRVLALSGFSRKEAADLMGRTHMAIKGRSQALGLRFTRDTYGGFLRPYDIALPQENRSRLEDSSKRLVRAVAGAIQRGENLPRVAK